MLPRIECDALGRRRGARSRAEISTKAARGVSSRCRRVRVARGAVVAASVHVVYGVEHNIQRPETLFVVARHCVIISSSSRMSSSSVSQTARRRSNPIERLSFCRIVHLRRPYTHPRLDSTRVSSRSRDAYMTILHFRAVISGVDTSRRALDLDASSFAFLSFLSFPPLIQLVPTQTRRARLPVCARKPLGGQVLFTARTISRPIVVLDVVVDAVLFTDDALRQLHIHQRLRRRVSRAVVERIVKVSERSSRGVASTGIRGRLDRSTRRRSVVSRLVSISRARPAFTMF